MSLKRVSVLGLCLCALLVFGGCPEKETPEGPPRGLLDSISRAEGAYNAPTDYPPTAEDSARYNQLLSEAKSLLESGDYAAAGNKAKLAEIEAYRARGRAVYRALLAEDPPKELTYYYRVNTKKSEDAEASGDLAGALSAAKEALKQAELALEHQDQCMTIARKKLERIKTEIESIYRVDFSLVTGYWDAKDAVDTGDCAKATAEVNGLAKKLKMVQDNTISSGRVFYITAPRSYIKQYGQPYLYAEITDNGYLQGRIARVQVDTPVIFLKSHLFSRSKTFYFVQDSATGKQGWVAEERVWPSRASRMQGLNP